MSAVAYNGPARRSDPGRRGTDLRHRARGAFGRFQYVHSKGVFILVNDINQNVYVYKPDFSPSATRTH